MPFIKTSSFKDQIAAQEVYLQGHMDGFCKEAAIHTVPRMTTVPEVGETLDDLLLKAKSYISGAKNSILGDTRDFGRWISANPKQTLGGVAAALALRKLVR